MKKLLTSRPAMWGTALGGVLTVAFAGVSSAAATYDLSPVVTSFSSELGSNLPVIIGAIGVLIALAVGIRAVRKFLHV